MTQHPEPTWDPTSWQSKTALHQPGYAEGARLERVLSDLARLPPLVTSWEVNALREQLAEAAEGKRFLLQGGDCAESFESCTSDAIASQIKVLLQMSLVLVHGLEQRVVRVGRIAGQYAKPRSAPTEARDGVELPSYRGDLINRAPFTEDDRAHDPELLLRGYERAALTLNFVRALMQGGFADLHHPEYWNVDFVRHSPLAREYQERVDAIGHSIRFMEVVAGASVGDLHRADFYTSHEALHLLYEQAQTRRVPRNVGWFNLSTHFPWIGMRTATLSSAHVEYMRGIRNPIAIKVGAGLATEELCDVLDVLDPEREPGRITLVHRFGVGKIEQCLPPVIEAVRARGRRPLWCCDPMHGNTQSTASGYKTRRFDDILGEVEKAFDVHERLGSRLGGVHIELTGENVTECTGGARGLSEADLGRAYKSQVDPRLNYEQAIELAMLVARRAEKKGAAPAR